MTDDRSFDRLLEEGLTDLPEAEVLAVTPWRKSMTCLLWGVGLTTLTLNFWYLNYLMPAVGAVLLLLGSRPLRRENGWFRVFWLISLYDVARTGCLLVLSATLWRPPEALAWLHMGITLAQFLCLWQGIKAVRRKAGQPDEARAAGTLVLWYLLLCLLAAVGANSPLLWAVIIAYVCILRSLSKVPALLDGAGYVVKTAPVRTPDWVIWAAWIAVLALCVPMAGCRFGRYHLDWTPAETVQRADLEEIRTDLGRVGFLKSLLDDLPEEELRRCAGAIDVAVQTEKESGAVWDAPNPEPEATAVVVRLSDEDYRVIHFFRWGIDPPVRGMDAVELWPPSRGIPSTWGNVDGMVLCQVDGATQWAPMLNLEGKTVTRDDTFFGRETLHSIYGEFTYPVEGEHCRGYVAYDFHTSGENWTVDGAPKEDQWYLCDFWLNYVHQRSWINYPAVSGLDFYLNGGLRNDTFDRAQYQDLFVIGAKKLEPYQ